MSSEPDRLPILRLLPPDSDLRRGGDVALSTVTRLIASGMAASKAELSAATGLSRTTITGVVDRLLRAGVLKREGTMPHAGRGRPAESLAIDPAAGTILLFDCGARSTRLAVVDLAQRVLAERTIELNVDIGPTATLEILVGQMHELLAESQANQRRRCVVIGLPARVDYQAGVPVRPPIMPGWDGFRVIEPLRAEFDCHVILENDANLRALGESRALAPDQSPLMAVKIGTGVGAGLVTETGVIHHGSAGASGEMGHMRLRSAPPAVCRCGSVACLEAVASVPALLRRYVELSEPGGPTPTTAFELADLIRSGDPTATMAIRESATYLGEAIANMVNIFNPARVVISGIATSASDDLLAGLRSMVYERARPLATRNLQVAFSVLGERAGVAGAVVLGIEYLLSPVALSRPTYG